MLDPDSHVVFRPLQCQVPLSGFQDLRFCTSQYSERDRKLMRKLCHVLQAKFMANFNSKISYLLCKFQGGEKYESAQRLGIPCVTENWLYACVEQVMILKFVTHYEVFLSELFSLPFHSLALLHNARP
jgi:topoisomerase (DNA) II binding protein 1